MKLGAVSFSILGFRCKVSFVWGHISINALAEGFDIGGH